MCEVFHRHLKAPFLDTTILNMNNAMTVSSEYMETMHKVFVYAEKYRVLQKMKDTAQSTADKLRLEQYQRELKLFLYGHIGSNATEELLEVTH